MFCFSFHYSRSRSDPDTQSRVSPFCQAAKLQSDSAETSLWLRSLYSRMATKVHTFTQICRYKATEFPRISWEYPSLHTQAACFPSLSPSTDRAPLSCSCSRKRERQKRHPSRRFQFSRLSVKPIPWSVPWDVVEVTWISSTTGDSPDGIILWRYFIFRSS